MQLWQFKLVYAQVLKRVFYTNLISPETVLSIKQEIVNIFDMWECGINKFLMTYLLGNDFDCDVTVAKRIAAYVTFYDIPYNLNVGDSDNVLEIISNLQSSQCSPENLNKLLCIMHKQLKQ